jgi:KaiC/GvpD/RAD55 family RecA-like ATPase
MPKKISNSLSDVESNPTPDTFISSGNFKIDMALGGGFPEGVATGLMGESGSHKTTTAVNACVEAQKKYPNSKCLYIITEAGGVDLDRCASLGLDLNRVDFLNSSEVETLIAEFLSEKGKYSLSKNNYSVIVIDSLHSITNTNDTGADGVGYQKSSQFIKKFLKVVNAHLVDRNENLHQHVPCTVLILLQISTNISPYSAEKYIVLGGNYVLHILNSIVIFDKRKLSYTASGTLDIRNFETFSIPFISEHPDMYPYKESNVPFDLIHVTHRKDRGVIRQKFSFVCSRFNLSVLGELSESFAFKAGKEVIGLTLYELCKYYDLIKTKHSVPFLNIEKGAKHILLNALLLGVQKKDEGEFEPLPLEILKKKLTILMRYEALRMTHKEEDIPPKILPSDGYLCGYQFLASETKEILDEIKTLPKKEATDISELINKYL